MRISRLTFPLAIASICAILAFGGPCAASEGSVPSPIATQAPAGLGTPKGGSPGAAAGASPGPCPAIIPVSVLADYQALRGAQLEKMAECKIALFPRGGATQSQPLGDLTLIAKGSSLQLQYIVNENEQIRNRLHFNNVNLFSDDNITVVFFKGPGGVQGPPVLFVSVNPSGNCTSPAADISVRFMHQMCKVTNARSGKTTWQGTLSIPLDALQSLGSSDLSFYVSKTHWPPETNGSHPLAQIQNSFPAAGTYLQLAIDNEPVARGNRYVSLASDIGYIPGAPPHRIGALAYYPIDAASAIGATFSDNAQPLNAVRDSTLKRVFSSDQYHVLACIACGSFKSVAPTAYDRTIRSRDVLGTDFSDLGVDSTPFSYDGINYPIDSEFGAAALDQSLAGAIFNGTTLSNGLARDAVFRGAHTLSLGRQLLQLSAFHVDSSRGQIATQDVGAYSPLPGSLPHTTNTELSAAFRRSTADPSVEGMTESRKSVFEFDALARYGQQYLGRNSSRLDTSFTVSKRHPVAVARIDPLADISVTLGFRDVGDLYRPNLGSTDPATGLRGQFAQITNNLLREGEGKPLFFSLLSYRFGDGVEARNTALTSSVNVPLSYLGCEQHLSKDDLARCRWSYVSLAGSGTVKHIAQSLVATGVKNPFTLPDSAGGAAYLPNGSYSYSAIYTNVASGFSLSAGFTGGDALACDANVLSSPCYAYRDSGLIVNSYGTYKGWLVFAVTHKRSEDSSLDLAPSLGSGVHVGAAAPLVENRIESSAGFAALLPGKFSCSAATATFSNQSAPPQSFIASAQKPGFTTTYGLDMVIQNRPATLFAGFARTSLPLPESQFILKLRIGTPSRGFVSATSASCENRSPG